MLDPIQTYDYLALARGKLLAHARTLTPEQTTKTFPVGPGSLDTVLAHIMISEWYYVQRILGNDVPPYKEWPIKYESPPPLPEIEKAWAAIERDTREAILTVSDWNTRLEYRVHTDEGTVNTVSASPAELVTQLAFHEIHHRAQAMNILRQLGEPCEDLDYNALCFERRPEE